jgi:hypothetical protein
MAVSAALACGLAVSPVAAQDRTKDVRDEARAAAAVAER